MTSFYDTYIIDKSIAKIINNERYWGAEKPSDYSRNGAKVTPNNKPPFHITIPKSEPKAFISEEALLQKGGLEALTTEVEKCAHGEHHQRKHDGLKLGYNCWGDSKEENELSTKDPKPSIELYLNSNEDQCKFIKKNILDTKLTHFFELKHINDLHVSFCQPEAKHQVKRLKKFLEKIRWCLAVVEVESEKYPADLKVYKKYEIYTKTKPA